MSGTIKDIAKITGLGLATVSAYINGHSVREKNKLAIEKAIKKTGYVRNEYARGLKTRRSMTIGILIPDLKNIFSTTIISSIEDVLRDKGYGIIVSDCKNDAAIEKKSIEFLLSKMVDGLIIMPCCTDKNQYSRIIDKNIPLVIIDRLTDANAPHILINNKEISCQAVRALIEAGHKKIAIITGDKDLYTANQRLEGYKQALLSANLEVNAQYCFDGHHEISGGYGAMKSIIEQSLDISAVFVTNYEMTLGAILAINEKDKKIPIDYSFIGFDNMEMSQIVTPTLATINQPLVEIGSNTALTLLNIITKKSQYDNIILNAEFISGNSIAKIN